MLGFLRRPLNDLCISRPKARLSWGIPLPFDESYVCYVWFDALINYITAAGYLQDGEAFARWWPASCHLIGKDILTTHCIYWPTMLKAIGVETPDTVMAHGWWLVDDEKMSKSLGNAIRPLDLAEKYGVDAFRYFLVREMVLGMDSSFGETGFVHRYNSELANDLGNLLNRTVVMANRYLGGRVPAAEVNHPVLSALKEQARKTLEGVIDALGNMNPTGILDAIWDLVRQANRFAEAQAPWNLAKDPGGKDTLKATIYGLLETMRHLAVLLFPVLPGKSEEIWEQIGADGDVKTQTMHGLHPWGGLRAGAEVNARGPIFPRIESVEENLSEKTDMADRKEGLVTFKEFQKLEFRVARVESAKRVPGADRLLTLLVSLGDEQRQIVAGVAEHYLPDSLVGRQIVVVANLEPATIRGLASEGMLLAASADGRVALLQPDADVPDGAEVG
jgi:methionyl-tRNA synthetase